MFSCSFSYWSFPLKRFTCKIAKPYINSVWAFSFVVFVEESYIPQLRVYMNKWNQRTSGIHVCFYHLYCWMVHDMSNDFTCSPWTYQYLVSFLHHWKKRAALCNFGSGPPSLPRRNNPCWLNPRSPTNLPANGRECPPCTARFSPATVQAVVV